MSGTVITGANMKALVDSSAKQYEIMEAAVGAIATADTVLYGMQANVDRIKAYTDEDPRVDLEKIFAAEKDGMGNFNLRLNQFALKALDSHIRRTAELSLGEHWEAECYPTNRFPYGACILARAAGLVLEPIICYAPVTYMGLFLVSGAAAGTFTDQNVIDGNLYGPADCELEVTALGNASVSLVATVIGTDENGSIMAGEATFAAAAVGDKENVVPTEAGRKFQDITIITITGGTADDEFKIQSKVDRAVSL